MITAQEKIDEKPLVLVAGGAGFIGSFLCETLLLQNCRVICIDNFSSGKKENLRKCLSNQNFSLINHDLTRPLPPQKRTEKTAYIFNLIDAKIALENLLKITKNLETKILTVALSQGSPPEELIKNFPQTNLRVVYLADVYGPRMNLSVSDPLVQLIKASVFEKSIKILEDGLSKVCPTFISDVIYGLIKAMFGAGTKGKTFSLVNRKEMTLLSLAEEIKKVIGKSLKINFGIKVETVFDRPQFRADDLNWHSKVDFKEGITETLVFFKKSSQKEKPSLIKKFSRLSPRWVFLFWLGLFLTVSLLLYPFASLLVDGYWGGRNLKIAQQAILSADYAKARDYARQAAKSFQGAEKKSHQFEITAKLGKLFRLGYQTGESLTYLSLVAEKASKIGEMVFQEKSGNVDQLTVELKTNLDQAWYFLSLLEGELKVTSPTVYQFAGTFGYQAQLRQWSEVLFQVRNLVAQLRNLIPVLPQLIGLPQKQTYLVLLQNNNELRPTGGFIGSFALMTFNGGRLVDFEVQDVYWADGQLKGHVEPPEELKRYLGEASWYLRDSNWSPDFSVSARKAAWFLEKETSRVVEGVIGINLSFVQRLLEVTGELPVVDFKEKIGAGNLFERAEYYSEIGFFPGSTQKQDFLGSLSRSLFEKLKNAPEKTWPKLAKAVYESLGAKDLLIYSDNRAVQSIMSQLGWDGGMKNLNCTRTQTECRRDYLFVVEANVGVNKANFFVKRNFSHQVKIEENGTIEETLKLIWENTAPTETFPGGKYRNYLQVYVPEGSELIRVTLNDPQATKETIPFEKVDRKLELNRQVFGLLVEVPVQEKRVLEMVYRLPGKIAGKNTQYVLLVQKQSGIQDESFRFWFESPLEMTVVSTRPKISPITQPMVFRPKFDQDLFFEVDLVR